MKKLSSSGWFGVVACIAMLAGCVTDETDEPAVAEDSVLALTEADQKEASNSDVEIAAYPSFAWTCTNPEWLPVQPWLPITWAWASSCQRRDGSWTGPRSWRGSCWLNVANRDGELVCE